MAEIIPATEGAIEPEKLSPEGFEIATTYLVLQDVASTAQELGLPKDFVVEQLNDPLVKRYLDTVFMDTGYRNRGKLGSTLDDVIDKKLEEMDEAEISSSKDIADLLQMAHKFRLDELKMQMEYLKLQASLKKKAEVVHSGPTVNIQDNSMGGSNYGQLMEQLLGIDHAKKKA